MRATPLVFVHVCADRLVCAARPDEGLAGGHADNVWALQSWCRKRFEGNEGQVDAFFKEARTESLELALSVSSGPLKGEQ